MSWIAHEGASEKGVLEQALRVQIHSAALVEQQSSITTTDRATGSSCLIIVSSQRSRSRSVVAVVVVLNSCPTLLTISFERGRILSF